MQHTETYKQASREFGLVEQEARNIQKQALALKIIADKLLAKAEEETLVEKVKRKIKGE
jgi:hypothetical protein